MFPLKTLRSRFTRTAFATLTSTALLLGMAQAPRQRHTVTFLGDGGCNMGHSWILAGTTAGMHIRISSPAGHTPLPEIVQRGQEIAAACGQLAAEETSG